MNQRNDKTKNRLFEMDDKLFDILASKSLWEESVYKEGKFVEEIEEYKKLGISVKNSYDFYKYISTDTINKFEDEMKGILGKINNEEKAKFTEIKKEERKRKEEEIIKSTVEEKAVDVKVIEENDDDDIDDIGDF